MTKLTYAMVHLNRKPELQKAVELYSPYVDRIVISDGESSDGSLEWLQSEEAKRLKVETIIKKQYRYPYGEHTPDARNPYLKAAGTDGWLLVTDSDEYIEKNGLENLRLLIDKAEAKGYDEIRFQAHDIWTYEDGQVYDNLSNYWKENMLIKLYPGCRYVGHTHSGIHRPGAANRWAKSGFQYTHEKNERQMWKNSTFLYWTTARNADNVTNDSIWQQFHKLMEGYGYIDWHEFDKAMVVGNLPQPIRDWFMANKDDENPEKRAYFMYYFIWLHPEENISHISNRDKSWDYLEQCRKKRDAI